MAPTAPDGGPRLSAARSSLLARLTAAGVLISAGVHLYLYATGFDTIEVIGPLFVLNAVAGVAIGGALLRWRHPMLVAAAVGFSAATLGAFGLSATVGLFGVREPFFGWSQTSAFFAEVLALVCGLALLADWWRGRRAV